MDEKAIRQKMERFMYLLRQEQELRDQVGVLSPLGPEKDVMENQAQVGEIMRKIESLRQEQMLPILNEVAAFVAEKKAALAARGSAAPAAKKPESAKKEKTGSMTKPVLKK